VTEIDPLDINWTFIENFDILQKFFSLAKIMTFDLPQFPTLAEQFSI